MRLCRIAAAILIPLVLALPARAGDETVRIEHKGLALDGRLMTPEGAGLADGVALITHGTLGHNRMRIVEAMQEALAERGLPSLAMTLSLGIDNRQGMYDCAVAHRHRHADALDEIAAWVDWLKAKGAGDITLLGHSRGGGQVAWFAAERPDPAVRRVVLLAPLRWSEVTDRESYQARHGAPLAAPLAKAGELAAAGKGAEMMKAGFLYCPDAAVSADSFLGYYQPDPRFDTPGLLERIPVPVLLVAASDDQVVKDLAEVVQPMADGEKLRLVTVEGDHMFSGFATDDAADAVEAFVR